MNVSKIMTRKVVCVDANASIDKTLDLMDSRNIKEIPVLLNKKYAGLLLYYDVISANAMHAKKALELAKRVPAVYQRDSINRTIQLMQSSGVGALPVVDEDKKIVGIISDYDVLKLLINSRIFDQIKVEDIVIKRFPILRTEDTIGKAQNLASINKIDSLPIIDNFGKLVGEVMISDIFNYTFNKRLTSTNKGKKDPDRRDYSYKDVNVMEVARKELPKIYLNLNLRKALEMMLTAKVKGATVIDNDNRPVGILSRLKILDLLAAKNIGDSIDIEVSGDYDWDFIIMIRSMINKRESMLYNVGGIKKIKLHIKKIRDVTGKYQMNMIAFGKKKYNIKVEGMVKEVLFQDIIDKLENSLEHLR